MKKTLAYFVFPILLFIFSGCSTTRITSSWTSADHINNTNYKKIVVVGLINDKDRRIREHMEAHLVGDLIEKGYDAVSSLQEFGPRSFEKMTEDAVLKSLRNANVDAVITISLLDKKKEQSYVPANIQYQPYATRFSRFYGYFNTYYERIYTPGYYETDTKYFFESSLYDLNGNDKDLKYSAQSEAFDPSSVDQMAHSYGMMIIRDMVKKGVLNPKK